MKCTIYLCDQCNKNLSKLGKDIPHISIDFGDNSGWVTPPLWRHNLDSDSISIIGIKQFCDGDCIGKYFNKLFLDTHTGKNLVKKNKPSNLKLYGNLSVNKRKTT